MLELKNVTLTHQKDLNKLINQLSLTVTAGDKLAIIGEEGTGKSSLLQAIYQPDKILSYIEKEGNITNHFKRMAYLPQTLEKSMLNLSPSDFLYQDLDFDLFDFNQFYQLANHLHFKTELLETPQLKLTDLSGGERLKLQLLKLLAIHPDLLLLDEPSADLDLESLEWLTRFIKESSITIIFISHDQALLEACASSILHLELVKKRTVATHHISRSNYADYVTNRQAAYDKQRKLATKEKEEYKKKEARFKRVHDSVQHQLEKTKDSTAGRLLAKKMKALKSQESRLAKDQNQLTKAPLEIDSLNLFFTDIPCLAKQRTILHLQDEHLATGQVISFLLKGQDKVVITGKNGIGKTQFLKFMLAKMQLDPTLSIGYMPQNYEEVLDKKLTPLEFLGDYPTETVKSLLASLQFTREEITHDLEQLSGGQRAKLFLAKMVLEKNNVLILDEPTRHLSPTSQPLVRQLFMDYPGAVISVSHDHYFIKETGFSILELTDQELLTCPIDR
ncbi:ATP-binding cassette domain-containing protein [Streptococcus hongkongensis]|nr:multidrug ABC transporter ATP-binding protein [Streptococcus uberis]